jgi:hypothetical protein
VVLARYLRSSLVKLNPGLPADAYAQAVSRIVETSAVKSLVQINREKNDLYRNGVPVTVKQPDGAVDIVYKSLQEDVLDPDVAHIIARLQPVIDAAVAPEIEGEPYAITSIVRSVRETDFARGPYDISKVGSRGKV